MKRLVALTFAAVTLAVAGPRQDTPPVADVPAVEPVGLRDRIRARLNPQPLPLLFVADPQEAPQPAPAPPAPMPKGPPQAKGRGYIPPTPAQRKVAYAAAKAMNGNRLGALAKLQALPTSFDARALGWAMPVGDQMNCGSCYEYSTVLTANAAARKAGYKTLVLSTQYYLDCQDVGGCGGGWGIEVIKLMMQGGCPAESYVNAAGETVKDYPLYEGRERSCRIAPNAKMWKPSGWGFCTADQSDRKPTIEEIKLAMVTYGTLNFALDAGGQFSDGGKGTITALGRNIDHEINAPAYDDNHDNGDGTKGAVLFQNQWNEFWGDKGYRWASYNAIRNCEDWFWTTFDPLPPPPDPGPIPPPDPTGGYVVTVNVPAGTPPGPYVVTVGSNGSLTPAERISLTQAREQALAAAANIDKVLGGGPAPVDRVPIVAPEKWVKDKAVAGALANAAKQKGNAAELGKVVDGGEHPLLMRLAWRKMRASDDGRAVLAKYVAASEADGGASPVTDILDWFVKNWPEILKIVLQIIAMFG